MFVGSRFTTERWGIRPDGSFPKRFRVVSSRDGGASPFPPLGPAWLLVRSVGKGGAGEVFEATHTTRGRVAVKVLNAALLERADVVDRMRLEAEILAHLRHPNIVEMYEMGATEDGRPFFAMEYLTGASLRATLDRRGRLPYAEAAGIACEALAGLGAAHQAGIVHRDVKPGNLYLAERPAGPQVKVVDFGVAKLVTSRGSGGPAPLMVPTAKGTVLGTPRYLSPEQIVGRSLDARADLYAVGLVLYRMLVGKGPFDDIQDFADMMRAQVTLMPPFPSSHGVELPRRLDLIVMKALAKKPEDRFTSAAEFACEIERVLHGSGPVRVRELDPPPESAPPSGSRVAAEDVSDQEATREMRRDDSSIQVVATREADDDTTISRPIETHDGAPDATLVVPQPAQPRRARRFGAPVVVALAMVAALPWLIFALAWASSALHGKH